MSPASPYFPGPHLWAQGGRNLSDVPAGSPILGVFYLHIGRLTSLFLFSRWVLSDSSMTPWTVARHAPLSMGFSRQQYWSGLPCLPPGDLPDPGIELESPAPPALAGRYFITKLPGKPSVRIVQANRPCVVSKRGCSLPWRKYLKVDKGSPAWTHAGAC